MCLGHLTDNYLTDSSFDRQLRFEPNLNEYINIVVGQLIVGQIIVGQLIFGQMNVGLLNATPNKYLSPFRIPGAISKFSEYSFWSIFD
jgi:hypothetical protein